jgi:hypothetical protein
MGKVRYLHHESRQRKCDGKLLVRVIMGKVICTVKPWIHVMSPGMEATWAYRRLCLTIWVIIDLLTYFLKYTTFNKWFMIENGYDKWLGIHFIWFIICLLSTLYSLLLLTLPFRWKETTYDDVICQAHNLNECEELLIFCLGDVY